MLELSVAGLIGVLESLAPAFTKPSFANFVTLALGWLLTPGKHAVTTALVVTGTSRQRHHSAFHRFFSSASWSPDELGRRLFALVLRLMPEDAAVPFALDDTVTRRRGPHIFGLGSHLDPVHSTKGVRMLCFGHMWVVLAVVIQLPFCRRPWGLPVLLRLYRTRTTCLKKRQRYRKRTELAREMLNIVAGWLDGRRAEIAADAAYCNDTVTRRLAKHLVLFGAMRPDAVLTAPPEKTARRRGGRPRLRGATLPKPEAVVNDERWNWYAYQVHLYQRDDWVVCKTLEAQWYRACGKRLLKIVIVKLTTGRIPFRVFFCTDATVTVEHLLERYASRWSIEVAFRDLKQLLGFADPQAWTRRAVERTAPFAALLFTIIVLWYAKAAHGSPVDVVPVRPWYRRKVAPSFADMLGAAQRAAVLTGVFDPATNSNNLHNLFTPRDLAQRRRH